MVTMPAPNSPDEAPLPTSRPRGRRRQKPRRRVTVSGVIGELLVTVGVVILAFMGWKFGLNDVIQGNAQNVAGGQLSEQFDQDYASTGQAAPDAGGVPIRAVPEGEAEPFAVLYVPRFGADYSRTIATGIAQYGVLNHYVGYYPDTQLPGEVGNFPIAGHRLAYGAPMQHLPDLQVGDRVYVETVDGWYTYVYRSGEYVQPTEVSILSTVPRHPDQQGTDRIMLLMTCNPIHSTAERMVAYTVFESFSPRSDGPPQEIAPVVQERQQNSGNDTGRDN